MAFKLDIAFTNEQLLAIYASGTNVIVAKPPSSGSDSPNVAWQVIRPLQSNSLTWVEEYGIYTSTTKITDGAKLDQLSAVPLPAVQNKLYTLQPSGVITGPQQGGTANAYSLYNNFGSDPLIMTVGLFQDASVNGTSIIGNAISAAPVLNQSTARMTPYTVVYVWLQSQVVSNSVVTDVTSPMTKVTFGGGENQISLKYDSYSGTFIPAATNGMYNMTSVEIETIYPIL
ncbi:MAG: hypothetical protein AAGA77_11720 [Bacteroidota bacterium]